jgi:hypothetical protein
MKEFVLIKTSVIIVEFVKCTNWEQNEKRMKIIRVSEERIQLKPERGFRRQLKG